MDMHSKFQSQPRFMITHDPGVKIRGDVEVKLSLSVTKKLKCGVGYS